MAFLSTITPLAAAGGADTFTSTYRMSNQEDSITGTVFTDQPGTIFIEQSADYNPVTQTGNWDVSTFYSVAANDGKGFSEPIVAAYWRIRFANTAGTPQTAFRLYAQTKSSGDDG